MPTVISGELTRAFDAHELLLLQYPEVVPDIGFTVLQGWFVPEQASRAALGLDIDVRDIQMCYPDDAPESHNVVTLQRAPTENSMQIYRLSVVCKRLGQVGARYATVFKRYGSAVWADTSFFNEQGFEYKVDDRDVTALHIALTAQMLLRDDRHAKKVAKLHEGQVQAAIKLKDVTTSPAQKKALKQSIEILKLK